MAILFSSEAIDLTLKVLSLEKDIIGLQEIENYKGKLILEYEGIKYQKNRIKFLLPVLRKKLAVLQQQLNRNDKAIYQYFMSCSEKIGKLKEYLEECAFFREYFDEIKSLQVFYDNLMKEMYFFRENSL